MNSPSFDPKDFSFHDAWIEHVSVGPRREISFKLELGSARISDSRLPQVGILRLGGIEEMESVSPKFARLSDDSRIDEIQFSFCSQSRLHRLRFVLDPHGTQEICCSKVTFTTVE